MSRRMIPTLVLAAVTFWGATLIANGFFNNLVVTPSVYDPGHSSLVASAWIAGIGCPTNRAFDDQYVPGTSPYTDPACTTGDADPKVEGLLLAKTGPTGNNAAGQANVTGVSNQYLSELGYDLRKPADTLADPNDPRGSHCGAGAPRFNVATKNGSFYFVGCNSPVATSVGGGPNGGWIRLRWGNGNNGSVMGYNANTYNLESITDRIKSIQIVFDEGQDTTPDRFGVAILDNINVNGLVAGNPELSHWWGWSKFFGW